MQHTHELIVLGAGPGGYVAALRAVQLGLRTALVERGALGGTCLNVGCIPSKALIQTAGQYQAILQAKDFGITAENVKIDFAKMMARKDRVVKRLTAGVGFLCRKRGVDVIQGEGRLTGPETLSVSAADGSSRELSAASIILAPGSASASLPGFEFDEERVLSSTGALSLKALPASMIVLGGGYIGVELGTVYAKLGTKVTIVELLDRILPGMEPDLVEPVLQRLRKLGVEVLLSTRAAGLERGAQGVRLAVESADGGRTLEAERILVSVGRKPLTAEIGLDKVGLTPDRRGLIEVDSARRTAIESIYAVGDVTSGPQLAHKASHEGLVAAERAAGLDTVFEPAAIPAVVFTDPEIACVGLSEQEALAAGHQIKLGVFPFLANGRALTRNEPEGFVKVIADKADGRVLGVRMVGPEASDLISEAALALTARITVEQLAETIHPHPTLSEALMEAALAAAGRPLHI